VVHECALQHGMFKGPLNQAAHPGTHSPTQPTSY
jgi:hypothetical protein